MKKSLLYGRSLRTQMILSFIALVLLTAAAGGLPAIWLIRSQLDRQAWAQVDQGNRTAFALYAAKQSEVANLATLTAQRPTLQTLLVQEDQTALTSYLGDLQAVAGFDMATVCASGGLVAAYPEETPFVHLCETKEPDGYYVLTEEEPPQVWLLASHAVGGDNTHSGRVIVGGALDNEFAMQMRAQTGLEHSLFVRGQPVATSFSRDIGFLATISRQPVDSPPTDLPKRDAFKLDGQPYYAARLSLDEDVLDAEVALAVGSIAATQRRLVLTLVASIVAVAGVASVLGTLLARRFSQPLVRLAESAATLSSGDLDQPVPAEAQVREVELVAHALDSARIDLQRTLAHLRKERDWGEHLLESIVEGIMTLDRLRQISFFSSGAERITGWTRDDVLGRHIDEVFKLTDEGTPFGQHIPLPGQKRIITVEVAGGRQATLAITGAKLPPSEADKAEEALVFRDVSEEEAINRLLGHFMSSVAHEFRTPLSALAASIELLLDQAPDLSAAELYELLTSLHLGVLGLQTLIDNLLESASIEARRFRVSPRPSDLAEIIAEAIQTMDPLLKKYGQRLVVELPTSIPLVLADHRRTAQVMVNLLSNASRHGPDDAEINIGVNVIADCVRVSVADRGPGIPAKRRDDVFRRFVRPGAEDETSKAGARLGLSVVKAIVDAHGGQVGVDDRPDGGAVFWFTLPLASHP